LDARYNVRSNKKKCGTAHTINTIAVQLKPRIIEHKVDAAALDCGVGDGVPELCKVVPEDAERWVSHELTNGARDIEGAKRPRRRCANGGDAEWARK
jgi:hypothetical protein